MAPAIYILIGPYGSGKTEVALNLARRERENGRDTALIDLDIINPYFRSREAATLAGGWGLRVISSVEGFEEADLPALSPSILGALQTPGLCLVFDVGGDPVGARVLGRFHALLAERTPEVWMVVNTYRPETGSPEAIVAAARRIAVAGRQALTGLVANPNLGPETDLASIRRGCRAVREAAGRLGLPVVYTAVREDLAEEASRGDLGPILPLRRYMLLPWER
ncbi:MAG: ATP-binding protein [Bacteroidota bacterium]